jgi:hypothetical protein
VSVTSFYLPFAYLSPGGLLRGFKRHAFLRVSVSGKDVVPPPMGARSAGRFFAWDTETRSISKTRSIRSLRPSQRTFSVTETLHSYCNRTCVVFGCCGSGSAIAGAVARALWCCCRGRRPSFRENFVSASFRGPHFSCALFFALMFFCFENL